MTYVCSAVSKTKSDNKNALSRHIERDWPVTFEDSSTIPDTVIDEIEEVMSGLTEEISWQAGDMVMIDKVILTFEQLLIA